MSTRSLNQIRKELTDFAASHGQIQTAKFGKQAELLEDGDRLYWAFYYDLKTVRKDKNEQVMAFTGWLASRLTLEASNEAEVWSDAIQIANDVLGFLDGPDRDYTLENGSGIKPFTRAAGDLVAGVTFDFTLRIPFPYDRCITPLKPSGFLVTEDGIYRETEQGQLLVIE